MSTTAQILEGGRLKRRRVVLDADSRRTSSPRQMVTEVRPMSHYPKQCAVAVAFACLLAPGGSVAQEPTNAPTAQCPQTMQLDLGGGRTMKLALIPAGKFVMGSPRNEKNRSSNEGPHPATSRR